jgi:hypothetical protein
MKGDFYRISKIKQMVTMRILGIFVGSFILIGSMLGQVHAAIPTSERDALIAVYSNTGGASWTDSTGWNGAAGTECTWFGVTCDAGETTVVELDLNTNNLVGTIPVEMGNLVNLEM